MLLFFVCNLLTLYSTAQLSPCKGCLINVHDEDVDDDDDDDDVASALETQMFLTSKFTPASILETSAIELKLYVQNNISSRSITFFGNLI